MRVLPIDYVSWSKILQFMNGGARQDIPIEILERGKRIHEMIQNSLNVFAEFTPIVYCKICTKKVWLLGHVDGVDFQQKEFIEIKSKRYYEQNKDVVLMQCAFYDYVLNQFLRKMGMELSRKEKFKCKIVLYEYDYSTKCIKLSEVYPRQEQLKQKWLEVKNIIKKL
ncbi:MAG: hypothetical protein QXO37_08765 [Candidatus Nitrosocaldaceae archaeon]